MNKTTLSLLLLLLLLAGGVWWIQSQKSQKTTLSTDRDWYMAIDDLEQIHKIFIANRNGETVSLVRNGDHWLYNDQYIARPNAVDVVLDVLKNVRLKYRPPKTAVESAVKELASAGVKVEAYDRDGNNLRTFYVGGAIQDERGTYMILEGSNNPYVMHLPAWEGNIRTRFFFGDNNWRTRTIFSEKRENIKRVEVRYPAQKQQSFVLEKEGTGNYTIRPAYEGVTSIDKVLDEDKVKDYLNGYAQVDAEGFENNNPRLESVLQEQPFANISLTNTQDKTTSVTLYPLYKRDDKGNIIEEEKGVERLIAVSDEGDHYLIQQRVFGKLFLSYPAFFKTF